MPQTASTFVLSDLPGYKADPRLWRPTPRPSDLSLVFAAQWLPPSLVDPVSGIYAFFKATLQLAEAGDELRPEKLAAWRSASRDAFDGHRSGHAMIDSVMGDAAQHHVPFRHIERIFEGADDKAAGRIVRDVADLRRHTRSTGGALGGWLTERAGVHDPLVVAYGYELGHAMQLTRIVRDVGRDLTNGRCFLPADHLAQYGLDVERLEHVRVHRGVGVPRSFRHLLEDLMQMADQAYDISLTAAAALPGGASRAAIIAGRVYQGIHDVVRRAGHDTLRLRVRTRYLERGKLAARALADLARMDRVRLRLARSAVAAAD